MGSTREDAKQARLLSRTSNSNRSGSKQEKNPTRRKHPRANENADAGSFTRVGVEARHPRVIPGAFATIEFPRVSKVATRLYPYAIIVSRLDRRIRTRRRCNGAYEAAYFVGCTSRGTEEEHLRIAVRLEISSVRGSRVRTFGSVCES